MKKVSVLTLSLMIAAGTIYAGPASDEKNWEKENPKKSNCEKGFRLPTAAELQEGFKAGIIKEYVDYKTDSGSHWARVPGKGDMARPADKKNYPSRLVRCIK